MDIHGLHLTVSDADVEWFLQSEHAPDDIPVEELEVRFTERGLMLRGKYPTRFLKVPFEMLWVVGVAQRVVQARLTDVSVVGLPAGLLRGPLLEAMARFARLPGVRLEGEVLHVEVDVMLQARNVPLRTNLTAIRLGAGVCVIEALGR